MPNLQDFLFVAVHDLLLVPMIERVWREQSLRLVRVEEVQRVVLQGHPVGFEDCLLQVHAFTAREALLQREAWGIQQLRRIDRLRV